MEDTIGLIIPVSIIKNLGEVSQRKITDGMEGLILIMKIRTSSDNKEHAFHANTSLKEL